MTQHFVKTGSPDEIRWEAHGLAWLADAEGAAVVPVLAWDERKLVEQRLEPVATTPVAAAQFGRDLARTHAAGAASFGCGPEGWDDTQPGWIGRARLPLGHHQCWGEFYAELRLLPHAGPRTPALAAGGRARAHRTGLRTPARRRVRRWPPTRPNPR